MESDEWNLVGTVLKNWYIISEIGSGAFGKCFARSSQGPFVSLDADVRQGVICAARDTTTGDLVAIKFEKADPSRQILRMEVSALKKLQAGTLACF